MKAILNLMMVAGVLLLMLASCKKNDKIEQGTVNVDIGFVGNMKPEPGTELVLNFYYANQEDTAFYEQEPGKVMTHTLSEDDIAGGLTLEVDDVQASPFTYLTAYADGDGDGQLSDRDIAVCYSELSLSDVMRGLQRARNVSGRTYLTVKMDARYDAFQRTTFAFTFPEPPAMGTNLVLRLYYADEEEPEFFNRNADRVFTLPLTEEAIGSSVLNMRVIVDEQPFVYATAYLDIDGSGTLNHGDMAVAYNGKSLGAVMNGEATADNATGLAQLAMPMDEWFDDPITDIDGNEYTTVVVGSQEWMVENLRVTHYANGDPIATDLSDTEWSGATAGAYAVYPFSEADGVDSEEQMIAQHGLLYNGYAAADERALAPAGWRVATDDDFKALQIQAGFTAQEVGAWGWRGTQGLKLRSTIGWSISPGTDDFGFTALPAGIRGANGAFQNLGSQTMFWSPIVPVDPEAGNLLRRWMQDDRPGEINRNNVNKALGVSVRCVRDIE